MRRPGRVLEYKAALNDAWDENYGLHAVAGGANIAAHLAGRHREVLLRPQDALGRRTTSLVGDRGRARQLPVRARLPRRLGARLPAVVAAGPRRRRHLHVRDDGASRPAATRPRSRSTRAWDENYGAGRRPGRRNIAFTVPADNAKVTFSYDAATHVLTIQSRAGHGHDNNVEWDGLRHDSRDTLYRTPGGAVQAGHAGHAPLPHVPRRRHRREGPRSTAVDASGQQIVAMYERRRRTSPCYQAGPRAGRRCDFWQADPARDRRPAGQPLVPVHRHRRHRHRLLRRRHRRARRRPRRADRRRRSTRAGR